MTPDLADIVARLRTGLPRRWFAEHSPNLEAILTSIATPWVWLVNLISYTVQQSRLTTAVEGWLDLIALDYFGFTLTRKSAESDVAFRGRIQSALNREAATRSAISDCLNDLVGKRPIIFEPARSGDTGCYGSLQSINASNSTGFAYGQVGGWGSLNLRSQVFITVARAPTPDVGMLAGYNTPSSGYGTGVTSYVDLGLLPGQITDGDIQQTLKSLLPINTVAWLRII